MNDIASIRSRLVRLLARGEGPHTYEIEDDRTAAELAALQQPAGSWPDVDYGDRSRSDWAPSAHLARAIALLRAAHAGESAEYWAAAGRALHDWVTRRPESDNWWHNDIGAPTALGTVLLLLGERAAREDRAAALDMLARVEIGKTGQNRVWLATIAFVRGLLTEDEALVRRALDEVFAEIRVTEEPEGIQPDWSFHQHGPQLYQGNYGAHFLDSCAPFATLLQGTAFAMPAEKVEILSRLALEGTAWLTWGSRMDYHVVGRFITSPERSRYEAQVLVSPVGHLAEADPPRREALRAFQASLTERVPPGAMGPTGNRHYWRSDVMVHRREPLYWSIRMSSERTVRSEACNGEGLQDYHLGDGVTLFLQSGDEYDAVFPAWDWRRLPGVTCRQGEGPLPVLSTGRHRGSTAYVGGVSDGEDGAAAMHYSLDGVAARKAWFCRGNFLVCLGAGISAREARIATSVNQCLLQGEATYDAGSGPAALRPPETSSGPLRWVHHAGIAYLLLDAGTFSVAVTEQAGSWRFINSNLSDAPVRREVFSLWIDHGEAPQAASYAYAVALSVDSGQADALRAAPGIVTWRNTDDLQAVAFAGGPLQAAFHTPGVLEVPGMPAIAVDRPCLVMARARGDGYALHVSDPTQREREVRVSVGGEPVTVALPQGGEAGKTVAVAL